MAGFFKFNDFSEQLAKGVHHIGTDTFKIFLSNTAPAAANTVLADIAQIAYANISGAAAPVVTLAESETAQAPPRLPAFLKPLQQLVLFQPSDTTGFITILLSVRLMHWSVSGITVQRWTCRPVRRSRSSLTERTLVVLATS